MRALHQVGGGYHHAVGFVDGTVAVGVGATAGRGQGLAGRALDVVLPGPDAVGIGAHLGQAGGREQVLEQARAAGDGPVIRLVEGRGKGDGAVGGQVVGVDQLHQPHARLAAQVAQVGGLEGLDEDRRVAVVPARTRQRVEQTVFQRQADLLVVGGVLGLGVDADRAARLVRLALGQGDDFFQRRNLELAVEGRAACAYLLGGTELLDLGQREVARPPAVGGYAVQHHGAAAGGKLRQAGDVGGGDEVGLMARDQVAVLGRHEVGFDEVGAEFDAQRIGLQRVLGQVAAAAAAVADDQRRREHALTIAVAVGERRAAGKQQGGCSGAAGDAAQGG